MRLFVDHQVARIVHVDTEDIEVMLGRGERGGEDKRNTSNQHKGRQGRPTWLPMMGKTVSL